MTIHQVVISLWNDGKSIDWIQEHVSHRYKNPMGLLILEHLRIMKSCEDQPGMPLIRDSPALER